MTPWPDRRLRALARSLTHDGRLIDDLVSVGMEASWQGEPVRWRMIDELRRQTSVGTGDARRRRPANESLDQLLENDEGRAFKDERALHARGGDPEPAVCVRDAVRRLPERLREVVVLRYWKGLTLADVGRELGVGEARACQLERKARAQLRGALAA